MTLNIQRTIFLIACLLMVMEIPAQDNSKTSKKPKYNSLLWEISGNGLSKSSYLYGTMHVSQKLAFHLGKPFFEAIESCSMVALELNPESWMKDLSETDLLQEAYTTGAYHNDFYTDAIKFPIPKNRELAYHIASEDNLINGLLYRSNNYTVDFEEDTYLDLYIFQTGRRMGKQIFSLENYKEVMEFSRKAMIPSKDEDQYNRRKMMDLFKDSSPQEVLQDSYRKGDLTLVDSVSKMMNPNKNFHKYMIVERNKGMAHNMDSIMQAGTSLFTGVGAAHLPGDYGVIELLRSKGYTVQPIEKGVEGKSKFYQEKYDNVIVPFQYQKQVFDKEFFSVDAPGTLYAMPSDGSVVTYLHPNMSNGAYYWVKRIKLNDALLGRSLDYTSQRIDSLLYENIPGEITSKKAFFEEHIRGFDITNKTRQDDKQQYRIYITPLEVLIFKMGGSKDFVSKHGQRFFKSIEVSLPIDQASVEIVRPVEGAFAVGMPPYHILYRLRNGAASGGPGLEYQGVDKDGDFYVARKTVLHDFDFIEEDDFELRQFVRSFIKESQYDSLLTRNLTYKGYPAKEASFSLKNTDKMLHMRIVIKGSEYFFLTKLTHKSLDECQDYFNSLQFEDVMYKNDFEALVDSTLKFETRTVKISDGMKLALEIQRMYYRSEEDEIDASEYLSKNRLISSNKTGEEILVSMDRYNVFSHEANVDSVWAHELRSYRRDASMEVRHVQIYEKDSLYIMEALLVDTGSTRGIQLKNILCNRTMYKLKATVDTLTSPSEFIQSTFDNFTILPDTVQDISLFEKKNDLFFDYLLSEDSMKVARAFESSSLVDLEPSDEHRMLDVIQHFHFSDHGMTDRAALIEMLSQIRTKNTLAFLKNEYLANEDTVTYQLACLSALAKTKTLESRKLLGELMVNYPTIPSENSEMNAIYYPLLDSLEISKVLFPDFMELSTYSEYKTNNLNLLSSLIEKRILKPRVMKKYKRRLVNEALIELKRQFAGEEGSSDVKNTSWNLRNKLSRLNYNLLDYGAVIAPWYKKEEKVKKFYRDIARLKNKRTLSRMVCMMEKSQVPVSDKLWDELARDPHASSYLLREMRWYHIEDKFNKAYLDPDKMAFSQLVSENKFENDSLDVEFIGKYLVASKELDGYYYFYKAKQKSYYDDDVKWALYYTGPQPVDTTKVNAVAAVNEKSENITADEDYQDLLDEILLKLEMRGRKRYVQNTYDDYGMMGY